MIRFNPKFKKVLVIGTLILLGCDVSLLFASPASSAPADINTTTPNLQLQQLQAQLNALNAQNAGNKDAVGNAVANQILSQEKNRPTPVLPASPFANQAASGNGASVLPAATTPSITPNSGAPVASPATNPDVLSQISTDQGLSNAQVQAAIRAATANRPANLPAPPPLPEGNMGNNALQQQAMGTAPVVTQATSATVTPPAVNGGSSTLVSENELNNMAFNAMVKNSLPLSATQIQQLRSMYMASQYAASSSPITPPRPTATSVFVDLSPGATPPVVRLAQGFVTSLVFVDSTGAPWPISAYDIGNPSAFNIQWDKVSNTLMIQATVLYTYGNLAVKLKGLDTPVMITLIPGQKAVDYRVDMRIPGVGPEGRPLLTNQLPPATSSELLNVLDGIPPAGSKILKVEGGNCQAWLSGSTMYVRTRLNVLSPGWQATLSSADGMHAYEMQQAPMLLVSQNGQVIQLKVEGF